MIKELKFNKLKKMKKLKNKINNNNNIKNSNLQFRKNLKIFKFKPVLSIVYLKIENQKFKLLNLTKLMKNKFNKINYMQKKSMKKIIIIKSKIKEEIKKINIRKIIHNMIICRTKKNKEMYKKINQIIMNHNSIMRFFN